MLFDLGKEQDEIMGKLNNELRLREEDLSDIIKFI